MAASELDWAYIAGLIDGEGTLAITWNKSHPHSYTNILGVIKITNTNLEVLEWVKNITEVGAISKGNKPPQHNKIAYQWVTSSKTQVLPSILPYLRIKKKQAEILTDFQSRRVNNPYRPLSELEKDITDLHRIHELNKRGSIEYLHKPKRECPLENPKVDDTFELDDKLWRVTSLNICNGVVNAKSLDKKVGKPHMFALKGAVIKTDLASKVDEDLRYVFEKILKWRELGKIPYSKENLDLLLQRNSKELAIQMTDADSLEYLED